MAFPLLVVAFLGVAGAAGAALAHGRAPIWAVALVAAVPALFLHVAYFEFFQADDAFISYRYAANWADGHGPVWNAGDRVDGYTNFLWTGLLAATAKLGLPPPTMASWGGFAAATAALGATLALGGRWPERRPEGALRWHPLLAVLLLAANGSFAVWAFAGLETPLFTALITLGAYLHLREDAGEIRLPWSSLAFLAAALTRPEGLLIFGVTAAFKLYGWSRDGWSRDRMVFLLGWAALFALPYAFYFGWHWSYYEHPFPNTFYAKVGGGMDQYERGLTFLVNVGREYGVLLALFLPVPLLAWADRRRESAYLLTLLLAWAGYLLYIGGDSLALLRLFVPVLPVFYLLASAGALWVVRALWIQADRATAAALSGVALAMILAVTLYASASNHSLAGERQGIQDQEVMGRWLSQHVARDYTVAVVSAGTLPYYSALPAIDMQGLNDRHIAHRDVELGFLGAGHEKYDLAYVLRRAPQLIVLIPELQPAPRCRPDDYQPMATSLVPAISDLLARPELFARYRPDSLELEPGRWFNVLVRNDIVLPGSACQGGPVIFADSGFGG